MRFNFQFPKIHKTKEFTWTTGTLPCGITTTKYQQLHPIYPFPDRKELEDKVFGPSRSEPLSTSCAFSALYHTVLALRCQYHEGGTFDTGNGRVWKLFQLYLGLVSDILIPREALMGLQVC